jgi:HD-GYP domain-containing protein (c-di-GMP phosphodiesterase class II)
MRICSEDAMASKAWSWAGIAVLVSPLGLLAIFKLDPSLEPWYANDPLHFWGISGIALGAAAACAMLILSAPTLRETRLLFLALSFLTIAGVFSVHGLMTSGYIAHEFHSSVDVSPWISTLGGGIFVALSVVGLPAPIERCVRRAGIAVFAWTAIVLVIFIAVSLTARNWLDSVPSGDKTFTYSVAAISTALYAFAILRYIEAYRFARLPSQAAMVACLVLLAEVPALTLWGEPGYALWWTYHALYGVAFGVLLVGWAIEVRRARSLSVIAEGLSMRDALAQLNRGQDTHVLHLVDAIEAKDVATLGHVGRVARYAIAIGQQLSLPSTQLRDLALAAQMHDVGKLGVPDAILRKPASLTKDEYAEIKKHASRGFEIANRVEALRGIAPVIRAHHERLNGQGYPDGLRGEDIPLLARIIAVADTYDAITSTRPYRPAAGHESAVAELRRVSGTELDERCVRAFLASFSGHSTAAAA